MLFTPIGPVRWNMQAYASRNLEHAFHCSQAKAPSRYYAVELDASLKCFGIILRLIKTGALALPTHRLALADLARLIAIASGGEVDMEHMIRKSIKNLRDCPPSWSTPQIRAMVQKLMDINGKGGVLVKTALLGGIGQDELIQLHRKKFCFSNPLCLCNKLHLFCDQNEVAFVATTESLDDQTEYLILPMRLWEQFRKLDSLEQLIAKANKDLAKHDLTLERLPMIFAAIHAQSGIEVLVSSCELDQSVYNATHVAILALLERYAMAWEPFEVLLSHQRMDQESFDFDMTA